ncbi:hypothetical protein DIPPA_10742 [Diplonema papillatum]|nr:hypothetical protein DIPPA_35786 [Diplonema papillatum]KAJ9452854.1 hypothetical protein DIPPA_10742 [Diplonema papillatum]
MKHILPRSADAGSVSSEDDAKSFYDPSNIQRLGSIIIDDRVNVTPPPNVPFVRPYHPDLNHFASRGMHDIKVVHKVNTGRLRSLIPSSPLRVAIISSNSLFICDLSGPTKRLLKLSKISQIFTQMDGGSTSTPGLHILIKVPTEHDLLLTIPPDPRNDDSRDFIETLRAVWSVDRYKRRGDNFQLPLTAVAKGKKIENYAQLEDLTEAQAKQKCKSCLIKDAELSGIHDQLLDLTRKHGQAEEEAGKVAGLQADVDRMRHLTAQAHVGRDMYKDKCKQLMLAVDTVHEELDEWRDFAEVLVKQIQLLNAPNDIHYLCHPRRVAQLEWRLEQADFYKQAYLDLKAQKPDLDMSMDRMTPQDSPAPSDDSFILPMDDDERNTLNLDTSTASIPQRPNIADLIGQMQSSASSPTSKSSNGVNRAMRSFADNMKQVAKNARKMDS